MLLCRLLGMASPFPRDNLTRGLARDADGRVLVNLDESSPWDREATDNDQATRGLLRDASGAILARVTGLPPSVGSAVDVEAAQDAAAAAQATADAAAPGAAVKTALDGQTTGIGNGSLITRNPLFIDPTLPPFNVKFDRFTTSQASMSASSSPTQLTVSDYTFLQDDVGKKVKITGAGASGANLKTTIASVSGGKAILAAPAQTTVSGAFGIFGTDNAASLQALFNALSDGSRNNRLSRTAVMPDRTAMFSGTLYLPRRGTLKGTAENWVDYDLQYGRFGSAENKQGSVLYQLWDQNVDGCRVIAQSVPAQSLTQWQGKLHGFIVEQDAENTAGKGISFRDSTGTPVLLIDGGKLDSVAAMGFASTGIEFPCGAITGTLRELYAFCNGYVDGAPGIDYKLRPTGGGDQIHFDAVSGDQNAGGLLRLTGPGPNMGGGTVLITNLKNEFGANVYRDPTGAPKGANAIVFANMGGVRVVARSIRHHAVSTSAGTNMGATFRVEKTNLAGEQPPYLSYEGVLNDYQAGQSTGKLIVQNDISGQTILYTSPGRGVYDGSDGSGTTNTIVDVRAADTGRRYTSWGPSNQFQGPASGYGESEGQQIAGQPAVFSWYNGTAPAGKRTIGLVGPLTADGTYRLRGLRADFSLDGDAFIVRRNAPGMVLEVPVLAGANVNVLILGRTSAQIDAALSALSITPTNGMIAVDSANALASVRLNGGWRPMTLGAAA